jgi:DNA-binding SARP family transcriptional activator
VRLEITLTGDVTVGRGDQAGRHSFSGPPRVVLAALVFEREAGVSRDQLAEMLWPDGRPRTWASALRTHVSRVRTLVSTTLGGTGETVVAGDGGYQLTLPADVTLEVDVDQAERALGAARAALAAGDAASALRLASGAADRVHGPFLPGHHGPWVDAVRERLADVVVGALELTAQAALATGDLDRALAAAEEAVQRAPLRESAHRSRLAALDAAGNRAEALRAYQRLRRVLADELGVDPSPETEAAYLALLGPAPPSRSPRRRAPEATGPGLSATGPSAPAPFVGREAELATLAAAWEQAAAGARHVVVVTGEAGIGKSRLTLEAAHRIGLNGGLVLYGRCDHEAIVPYQPIVEALDGFVAATPPDELPVLGNEAMAELAAVLPSLDGPRRPTGSDGRARLFGAVTELVATAARERPLLLVLDDLQWADEDTLLLVRHLLRRADDAPVLVVAISRDHDLQPGHPLGEVVHSLDRDGWVRRLPLQGLTEADVRELLARTHVAGDAAERAATARQLVAESAGNPFLVTELLGAGAPPTAGPSRAPDLEPGAHAARPIPQSVHELVASRLSRLDGATTALLRAAAVAGARFDLDVAADAAGLDQAVVLDAVDAALSSGLVVEESADRYRFAHHVVRRTLVAQLSGARRRALHDRLAGAIERLRAHELDRHAAALAHHSSAGAGPGGDARAVRWARLASAQAAERSAPAEAVRLCRQALAHVPASERELLAEVTAELGIALLAAGDDAAAATLVDGAAQARRLGRTDVLGRAALSLADAADERPGVRADARALVDAAVAASASAPEAGDALTYARLLVRQVRLTDRPRDRSRGQLVATARPPVAALEALHERAEELADPRYIDERRRVVDELEVLAENAGDPTFRVLAAHEQAMVAACVGDQDRVGRALVVLASAAADRHDAFADAMLAEREVARLTYEGNLAQAWDALTGAVAAHHALAGPEAARAVEARHAPVIRWLWADAPPRSDPAEPVPVPVGHAAAVLDLLAADQPDLARARLRILVAGADPIPEGAERLHALGVAALAAPDIDDLALVAEIRTQMAPHADLVCGLGYRSFAGAVAFHLGRLAAAAGDWADAERHLLAALRLHTAWRARPWMALTQGALAAVLDARGRPSDRDLIAGLHAEATWVATTLAMRAV